MHLYEMLQLSRSEQAAQRGLHFQPWPLGGAMGLAPIKGAEASLRLARLPSLFPLGSHPRPRR